jgi:hypothetical protein
MQLVADLEAQLDSDALAAALMRTALRVQLTGLNGLAASGLFNDSSSSKGLSLCFKFGRVLLEKRLPPVTLPATE